MDARRQTRRHSRRVALCGLLAALAVVLLSLGSLIPLATFACPLLAMVCLLPALWEYGAGTALLLYAGTACLALLLCADKELALFYCFLGWYPAFRGRLARLPRPARAVVKCALFVVAMAAMYGLILSVFRLEAVVMEFSAYSAAGVLGLLALGTAVFLLFDRALEHLTALYRRRRGAQGRR